MNKFGLFSAGLSILLAAILIALIKSGEHPKAAEEPVRAKRDQPSSDLSLAEFTAPKAVLLPPPPASPSSLPPKIKIEVEARPALVRKSEVRTIRPAPAPVKQMVKPGHPSLEIDIKLTSIAEGRALLRLMEHGKGPSIEIAWPASDRKRQQLYRLFSTCFGMRSALMDQQQRLFIDTGAPGEMWRPDFDRLSGYMRQTAGLIPAEEQRQLEAIERHHGGIGGIPVRLFPRRIDAVIFGGLHEAAVNSHGTTNNIRARYEIEKGAVLISNILINGRPVTGRLNLSRLSGISGGRCLQI